MIKRFLKRLLLFLVCLAIVLGGIGAYIGNMAYEEFYDAPWDQLLGIENHSRDVSTVRQWEKERGRAQEALEKLGIEALAKRSFPTLSGGEQQLVLIARALAQQAKVLVMDEPAASLDFGNQVRLFALLKRLAEEGFTVLISLHNPQQVFSYADRVLALEEGTVLDVGSPGNVLTPELLHRLYRVDVSVTDTPFGTAVLPKS